MHPRPQSGRCLHVHVNRACCHVTLHNSVHIMCVPQFSYTRRAGDLYFHLGSSTW